MIKVLSLVHVPRKMWFDIHVIINTSSYGATYKCQTIKLKLSDEYLIISGVK